MPIRKLKNLSIKAKIQVIIFFSIIIIALFAFISIHFISKSYKDVLYRTLSGYLSYSGTEMSKQLDDIDKVADMVFAHETIQDRLMSNKYTNINSEKKLCQANIYTVLNNYVYDFEDTGITYISIFQGNDIFTTSTSASSQLPPDMKQDLFSRGKSAEGASTWVIDYSDTYGLFLVKEIFGIKNLNLENLGVMIIQVDLEKLVSSTAVNGSYYDSTSYLIYDNAHVMYHSSTLSKQDAQFLVTENQLKYQIVSLGTGDVFAVYEKVPKYGWNYIITVSYDSITDTITLTQRSWLLILILCIVSALIFTTGMLKSLTRHLDLLVQKMKLFGVNNYESTVFPTDYSNREDEIGILHNTFDSMVTEINLLIEKNYTNELLKKESQIQAMESQMDPHFLYNTLDSLNWRAKTMGATDISEVTIALASLLRITLSNSSSQFTISQEVNTLNYYFTIQKMRYQKRLMYTINIPDELMNCEIPKLTLQPLVENSIRYGLETITEVCHISIHAKKGDGIIIFEIINNGSSFESNLLDKLLSKEIIPNGFGVGISNIHKRIQLTYGQDYGIRLYNLEDELTGEEYAVVQVKLPMIPTGKGGTDTW